MERIGARVGRRVEGEMIGGVERRGGRRERGQKIGVERIWGKEEETRERGVGVGGREGRR